MDKKKIIKRIIVLVIAMAAVTYLSIDLYNRIQRNRFQARYDHIWDIAMEGDALEARTKFLKYKVDSEGNKNACGNPDFSAEFCEALQALREEKYEEAAKMMDKIDDKKHDIKYDCGLNRKQNEYVNKQITLAIRLKYEKQKKEKQIEEDKQKSSSNSKKKNSDADKNSHDNKSGISSSTRRKKNKSTEAKTVDPMDHDIDMYYEDYKDEFLDEDDAWDDFEDNEDVWDDY